MRQQLYRQFRFRILEWKSKMEDYWTTVSLRTDLGSSNDTSSSTSVRVSTVALYSRFSRSSSADTRCSGALAPAVTRTDCLPSSHAGSISDSSSIKNAGTPCSSARSTSRLEFELFL